MSDYGRQITFFGKSLLQLSAQTNKQGLPTLTLELTTSEAGWDQFRSSMSSAERGSTHPESAMISLAGSIKS